MAQLIKFERNESLKKRPGRVLLKHKVINPGFEKLPIERQASGDVIEVMEQHIKAIHF